MDSTVFCYHILVLFVLLGFPNRSTAVLHDHATDLEGLLAIKSRITDDPLGSLNSWNTSRHHCEWLGVTCDLRHQRVISVDLTSQKLTGSISPYVGNLSFLKVLNLANNSFMQQIPPEIGNLRRLVSLELNNNSIVGEIPANLSGCISLVFLYVSYNRISGRLPQKLGTLSKLKQFGASVNYISGEIPSSLGNLSSLDTLSLASNNFEGTIPDTFGQLKNLELIAVGDNKFRSIASSLFNLSSLSTIDLGINGIRGGLPPDLGNTLPNLSLLSVIENKFIGSIPSSLSNASNLEYIALGSNLFTGDVPNFRNSYKLYHFGIGENFLGSGEANDLNFISHMTNATNLKRLGLHQNNFGGKLPESFKNLSKSLIWLSMARNKISGSFPVEIVNFINLENLKMGHNQFTGTIPHDIDQLQNLQYLSLSGNKLSGIIPSSVGNLRLLVSLFLSDNNLQGNIPSSLGNCKRLLSLDLSQNSLNGSLPVEMFHLPSIGSIKLSGNKLGGPLPQEVGNWKNVGYLNIYGNNFSGEIPFLLGNCIRLQTLIMRGNFFQGIIPSSFSNLRGIQFLDLSHNNLSGEIPGYLGSFVMELLDLSFNNFIGALPENGLFKNSSVVSVIGNSKLCGNLPDQHLPKCNFEISKSSGLSLSYKLIMFAVSAILGMSLILAFVFIFWLKRSKNMNFVDPLGNEIFSLTYQTLFLATNGFSAANLIGKGSFGSVYKGTLDPDAKLVAVKVLNLLQRGASKSFFAECETLKRIQHRNLVQLLSAYSGVDHQGNEFKALVYEFMVGGSSEQWLHPPNGREEFADQKEPRKGLNLPQRLDIAIDVASALDYLHHQCETPIIHCDLKPSNVLLDNEFVAHVGDFGLARFLSTQRMNQTSSNILRGSIGYAAPEYGVGSEVSTYGDMYSFGILLLEMFTGKRPTNEMFKENLDLHNFVSDSLANRVAVADIVDPSLLQDIEEGIKTTSNNSPGNDGFTRSQQIQNCIVSILRVGVSCSKLSALDRKNASDAVSELFSVRYALLAVDSKKFDVE